jgi:hypothetical protein
MLKSRAAFSSDLCLNPALEFTISGKSIPLKSSVSWILIGSILRMVCLDGCPKKRGFGIAGEEDDNISGFGSGKTRLMINDTPLFRRVG